MDGSEKEAKNVPYKAFSIQMLRTNGVALYKRKYIICIVIVHQWYSVSYSTYHPTSHSIRQPFNQCRTDSLFLFSLYIYINCLPTRASLRTIPKIQWKNFYISHFLYSKDSNIYIYIGVWTGWSVVVVFTFRNVTEKEEGKKIEYLILDSSMIRFPATIHFATRHLFL